MSERFDDILDGLATATEGLATTVQGLRRAAAATRQAQEDYDLTDLREHVTRLEAMVLELLRKHDAPR